MSQCDQYQLMLRCQAGPHEKRKAKSGVHPSCRFLQVFFSGLNMHDFFFIDIYLWVVLFVLHSIQGNKIKTNVTWNVSIKDKKQGIEGLTVSALKLQCVDPISPNYLLSFRRHSLKDRERKEERKKPCWWKICLLNSVMRIAQAGMDLSRCYQRLRNEQT